MTSHQDVAARLRATLGGVAQEECCGDNLAILLASHFEPFIESEELDDSETWRQGAIDASNKVLDAIHAHYATLLESQAKALSEADSRYNTAVGSRIEWRHAAETWQARALAAEGRLAEARKVIEPFAEAAADLDDTDRDTGHIWEAPCAMEITVGMLRAARSFLNAAKEKTDAS